MCLTSRKGPLNTSGMALSLNYSVQYQSNFVNHQNEKAPWIREVVALSTES